MVWVVSTRIPAESFGGPRLGKNEGLRLSFRVFTAPLAAAALRAYPVLGGPRERTLCGSPSQGDSLSSAAPLNGAAREGEALRRPRANVGRYSVLAHGGCVSFATARNCVFPVVLSALLLGLGLDDAGGREAPPGVESRRCCRARVLAAMAIAGGES